MNFEFFKPATTTNVGQLALHCIVIYTSSHVQCNSYSYTVIYKIKQSS
jgi:hypothetical protein